MMTELIDIGLYSLLGISLIFSFRYIIEDYGCPAADDGSTEATLLLSRKIGASATLSRRTSIAM